MGIRNQVIDEVCNRLRRLKTNEFQVRLRGEYGTPEENTEELLELVARDFDAMRSRTDEVNLFIGRLMGGVLLIELKLESLLVKVDPDIGEKMLGRKIDTLARLLNELAKPDYGYERHEIEYYRELLEPLREVSRLRNRMAHNLRYTKFQLKDVPQTVKLVRRRKRYLDDAMKAAPKGLKPLVAVMNFGFIVSEQTAMLQQALV